MNDAINKLNADFAQFNKDNIDKIHRLNDKQESISSKLNESNISNDRILNNHAKCLENINEQMNFIRKKFNINDESNSILDDAIKANIAVIRSIANSITTDKELYIQETKNIHQEIENAETRCKRHTELTISDVVNRPCPAQKVKEELLSKIDSHRIDNAAINKEMALCKKANFINEKKIENIYTLIERIAQRLP